MRPGEFNSIADFFQILNEAGVRYLVLRNFENLLEPEMYLDGHGDIDLLGESAEQIVLLTGALSKSKDSSERFGDGIHYSIYVAGQFVSLDLRQVGDGYYCEKWEKNLLERREEHECFFVMPLDDYFYTLIYHAILQKPLLSDEYRKRLSDMATKLGVSLSRYEQKNFLHLLEFHMKENNYKFTFPIDYLVPCRFRLVSKSLIEWNARRWWRHTRFATKVKFIEMLVRIKHATIG